MPHTAAARVHPLPPKALDSEIPLRVVPPGTFPPYSFVPGHFPHPVRSPEGHSYRTRHDFGPAPTPENWQDHPHYLFVLQLFNRGYYWEAHEGLEHWWKVCPLTDWRRPFFQSILHLAAAGVKARQGQPGGVHSHGTKAEARMLEALHRLSNPGQDVEIPAHLPLRLESQTPMLGMQLEGVVRSASDLALRAQHYHTPRVTMPVEPVLEIWLGPR